MPIVECMYGGSGCAYDRAQLDVDSANTALNNAQIAYDRVLKDVAKGDSVDQGYQNYVVEQLSSARQSLQAAEQKITNFVVCPHCPNR